MHILSPLKPLYYSVQLDDGQTSETDDLAKAEAKFEAWSKQFPTRNVKLCQVWISTVREHVPTVEKA